MIELLFLLKGLIVGFAMAIPIGPVGVVCIRKTLSDGRSRGLIIGAGAATADALFASMAAFGLTFISDVIAAHQFWFSVVGGTVLLVLGVRTFLAKPKDPKRRYDGTGMVRTYFYAFILVITNPVTVFAFIAVFAAVGLGHLPTILSASVLVLGVFVGSALWFITLSYVATMFRAKLDRDGFRWVNRIAGILILLSGIGAFIGLL